MTTSILVTGGTGTLGGHVLPLLTRTKTTVRVLTRHDREPDPRFDHVRGDLADGSGLESAREGVDVVLHLAGGPKGDDVATQNLMRAASAAHVEKVVYISVIGADRVPIGWFESKFRAETAIVESGIPWTILRAAQFHDLVLKTVTTLAKLPVMPNPGGLRFQPVDSRDVAERLVELTFADPARLVPDMAGPQVYTVAELGRSYLGALGKRRPIVPVRIPGKAGRAYRAGANLSTEEITVGSRTWEAFLGERYRQGSALVHRTP
ncbi:MAG: SDR family oxidoreductase [Rhodococcus sp.]|nr:SDR family oxidoreductase [Rhodococcus sp. (in: high G+C Gram-positive bacteria)]